MKLEAIILDVDGTLINDEGIILSSTKDILMEAQESGIIVILASGRPSNGVKKYADELRLDYYNGFIVSYNGGKVIQMKNGKILLDEKLERNLTINLLKRLELYHVIPMIDNDEYLFVTDVYDNSIQVNGIDFNIVKSESIDNDLKVCELNKLYDYEGKLNKIIVAGSTDYLKEVYKEMLAPFKNKINVEFSAEYLIEIVARNVSKAKGIKVILNNLNIEKENVIVFGDGENDISMFKYISNSIAMGNANDKVKKHAKNVTSTNNKDSIEKELTKYI